MKVCAKEGVDGGRFIVGEGERQREREGNPTRKARRTITA